MKSEADFSEGWQENTLTEIVRDLLNFVFRLEKLK
jgi:hypothetical protein